MHPPQDRSAVVFLRQNGNSTFSLIYCPDCNTSPRLSFFFAHFPTFNLICSGQVDAHKQNTDQRLMMQRHGLPPPVVVAGFSQS